MHGSDRIRTGPYYRSRVVFPVFIDRDSAAAPENPDITVDPLANGGIQCAVGIAYTVH